MMHLQFILILTAGKFVYAAIGKGFHFQPAGCVSVSTILQSKFYKYEQRAITNSMSKEQNDKTVKQLALQCKYIHIYI